MTCSLVSDKTFLHEMPSSILLKILDRHLKKDTIGCGIFVVLQKAFDTVDHEILLVKLNYYDVSSVSNDWFRSYLSSRQQ